MSAGLRDPSVQESVSERYHERRALRNEEKTLLEMMKKAQEQLTQLQVENLELRARARQEENNKTTKVKQEGQKRQNAMEGEDINTELELGVNHNVILEKVRT